MMTGTKRILSFSDFREIKRFKEAAVPTIDMWPHHARKSPLIGPPLAILDMPNLDTHIGTYVNILIRRFSSIDLIQIKLSYIRIR